MRAVSILLLLAALAPLPASAQSTFPLEGVGEREGPNARASQRPLGPNAQAAQRPAGANSAVRTTPNGQRASYPSCSAARAAQATPIRQGDPGYGRHLDRDGDGVACE
jgi:Excalibur calcium-binding domain